MPAPKRLPSARSPEGVAIIHDGAAPRVRLDVALNALAELTSGWVGMAALAESVGIEERAAQRLILGLVAAGIEVRQRREWRRTEYHVEPERLRERVEG